MAETAEIQHALISEGRAMQLCKRIRQNMTDARNDLLELYEGRGWQVLGHPSWRECVKAEFGQHQATLYRQLEAAQVAKELDEDPVFRNLRKTETMPESQLRALSKSKEGTRAQVLRIADKAAKGEATEQFVKAAVEAKLADPEATRDELVKAVVEAVARPKPPKAVVPDEVEEIREERAERAAIQGDVSDDEWVAALPLAIKLQGHALDKFRRDALDYRDLESTVTSNLTIRKALAAFRARAKGRQKGKVPFTGFTAFRVGQVLSVEHPRAWFQCPPTDKGGCDGLGVVGSIGECPMCRGRGYLPR